MIRLTKPLLTVLLISGIVCTASGQIELGLGAMATGGGMMSNGSYAAAGTPGQSVIGRSAGGVYAASAGFWGDGGIILAVEDPAADEIHAEFLLMQNYPNPFNPSTTIRYALPSRLHVILTIFNALGQQVATLVEGEMEAGYHETVFDASGLASGVYLYRVQTGDFVQSRKLVVLR